MPMRKRTGNMYPWVNFLKNWLGGECPHKCSYCCVQRMGDKFPNVKKKYSGKPYLIESELKEDLSRFGMCTIFIQNNGDLFAKSIPDEWIIKVLNHCKKYPDNTYLFQTKNPVRFFKFKKLLYDLNVILGTTIESNRNYDVSRAPDSPYRFIAIRHLSKCLFRIMISIEPIMDFDLDIMVKWMKEIKPVFVSIGADSKKHNLTEPPADKIQLLIDELSKFTEVRIKNNLRRLL